MRSAVLAGKPINAGEAPLLLIGRPGKKIDMVRKNLFLTTHGRRSRGYRRGFHERTLTEQQAPRALQAQESGAPSQDARISLKERFTNLFRLDPIHINFIMKIRK